MRPHLRRLLASARFLTGDAHVGEDVLQTALLAAFRSYEPAAHDDRFLPRMWHFITNAALDERRRQAIRAASEKEIRITGTDLVEALSSLESQEILRSDPNRFLEESGDQLRMAVLSLPVHEKWVLLLRVMGDFKYREIAEILEAPIGSVMTWLHRARGTLKSALTSSHEGRNA